MGISMARGPFILCILMTPVMLLSQQTAPETTATVAKKPVPSVQAERSDLIEVAPIYFNRKLDITGKGEVLEAEIIVENMTDAPLELYIFTIATYEKDTSTKSSFQRPFPFKEAIRYFVAFPEGEENFLYTEKDAKGKEYTIHRKYPKDFKKGVDPKTNAPYKLGDKKIVFRTTHLSKYRKNYTFFNEAAVLIFNKEGKLLFQQLYQFKGWRR